MLLLSMRTVHSLACSPWKLRTCANGTTDPNLRHFTPPAAGEPDNLKAVYRRGQALAGLKRWAVAEGDLKRAVALCPPGDQEQRKLIGDKLAAVQARYLLKVVVASCRCRLQHRASGCAAALPPITVACWDWQPPPCKRGR